MALNFDDKIKVIDFNVGNSVTVKFISPSGNKIKIILADDSSNLVLNIGLRYYENVLVLNHFTNGSWGSEQRPSGFDFAQGVETSVTVKAEDGYFVILQGTNKLAQFNYRLPVGTITKVGLDLGTGSPTLLSIGVGY